MAQRYPRYQLGKGHRVADEIVRNATARTPEGIYVEFEEIEPLLEQANQLMALKRYQEAEVLLRPYWDSDVFGAGHDWRFGHFLTEGYAHCLQHLPDKLEDALAIYSELQGLHGKPAEFYVNYPLALNRSADWPQATSVCAAGLQHYPDDVYILGNRTIALRNNGDLPAAQESALKRLSIRRDVNALEEAISVVREHKNSTRNTDLPSTMR